MAGDNVMGIGRGDGKMVKFGPRPLLVIGTDSLHTPEHVWVVGLRVGQEEITGLGEAPIVDQAGLKMVSYSPRDSGPTQGRMRLDKPFVRRPDGFRRYQRS
jgi:hypothetical protein